MKNAKKLISVLLAVIMILSLMPVGAFAANFTPDGIDLDLPDPGGEGNLPPEDQTQDGTNSILYGVVKGATFTNGNGVYLRVTEAFGSYMFVYFGADGTIYDFEDLKNVVLDTNTVEVGSGNMTMEFHCEGCQSTFTVIRVRGELFSYITTVIVNSEMSRYNGTYSQTDDIGWELFDCRTAPFKMDFSKIRNSTFLDPIPTEMGNRVLYASDMAKSGGCIVLESYFPEPDPDTFFPEGKFEIKNTADANVFRTSVGIVNGKITGSYAGKVNRSGSISVPVWLIESGSVTVKKVAKHTVQLTVDAKNSAGMAVSSLLLFEYHEPKSFDLPVFLYDAEKLQDGTYRYWFANEKNNMYFSVGAFPAATNGVTHLSFKDLDNPYCLIQASSLYPSGQESFAAADITMEEDPAAETISMDMTITGASFGDVFHLTYEGIGASLYLKYGQQRRDAVSALNKAMGIQDSQVAMDLLFRGTMAIRSAKNTDEINAAKEQYLGMIARFLKGKDPYHVHALSHFDAVDATCTDTGNIEYWFCEGCGEYYSDADAVNEITAKQTVTEKKPHTFATAYSADETDHWYDATCGHDLKDSFGEHVDTEPADHRCDVCGYVMSKCIDENGDNICDVCEGLMSVPLAPTTRAHRSLVFIPLLVKLVTLIFRIGTFPVSAIAHVFSTVISRFF